MSDRPQPIPQPTAVSDEKVYRIEVVYECSFVTRRNVASRMSGITLVSGCPFIGGFGTSTIFIGAATGAIIGGDQ